jgi:hypothetical protein
MIDKHTILGVHLTDRLTEAVEVQKLFTAFGGYIKTRLGLHEGVGGPVGSKNGLILLELVGPDAQNQALADKLNAITGVEAKAMTFEHH